MRERRYVKFRIDMYEDTKFKIIDRMPKRDLIHYVWSRIVVLAGKVNQEGDLYLSRSIPYTVETLSIEFNRDIDEIKTALDILMELEMIELAENKVYRVKNFAKHQNIKVKEKNETKEKSEAKEKENDINNTENNMMKSEQEIESDSKNEINMATKEETNSKVNNIDVVLISDSVEANLVSANKCNNKINEDIKNEKSDISQHNNLPVILEIQKSQKIIGKNKKVSKKKIRDDIIGTDENNFKGNIEEEGLCCWTNGEDESLRANERLVSKWGF
ncbi:replication protein [Clostridium chromiireducens]|uniref:Replication protein n=1 Tax=Clostridium chromiireducens TaxID=225345 RepID=A0A964RIL5_9CLOT|nr:phage replisome organizer N-terminal domain-containing protein [Clostridium chromiireducens]MVX62367.1 replication protein [Clostridium chromiireducens]